MNKSSLLGYLAKLYASIASLTDNKFYGFKNGQLAEITVTPTAPSIFDMDTFARMCSGSTAMWHDIVTKEYAASFGLIGSNIATATGGPRYSIDMELETVGSGSGAIPSTNGLVINTGTTATGSAKILINPRDLGRERDILTTVSAIGRIRMAGKYSVTAKSTATQRFLCNFLEMVSGGNILFSLSQIDTVNSGNLTFAYRNNTGTTTTLNLATTIGTTAKLAEVDIIYNGTAWMLYVRLDGTVVATVSDFCFISNITSLLYPEWRTLITKSIGTTTLGMEFDSTRLVISKR